MGPGIKIMGRMSHSVRRHLRVAIEEYDASIRCFIPGYDEMIRQAASAVADVAPKRVLDLGSGTGALAAEILRHSRVGEVELVDVDEEMLGQARVRLAARGERARFTLASFLDPLPACDAVAASLSLHHIPSLDAKTALFGRILAALSPGGVFVNADVTMPREGAPRDQAYRVWADHLVASGIAESRAWEHFEEWASEDTYFPVEEELAALSSVGFRAHCLWREGVATVVVATRETA